MKPAERIRSGLDALARTAAGTASQIPAVEQIAARCAATLRDGGTLFFAGNGGSAADAQHIATEYVSASGPSAGPCGRWRSPPTPP